MNHMKIFNECWISPFKYPQLKLLLENRSVIISELKSILHNDNWCAWYYSKGPTSSLFTEMSKEDIFHYHSKNKCKIAQDKAWKIFGLVLWGEILDFSKHCPKTMDLLSRLSNLHIINACFSCLEAGSNTLRHRDSNHTYYRCHIPLMVPKGNCCLQVEESIRMWTINDKLSDLIVFDDTKWHQAWNLTQENRINLIVDIKRY